ncbi:3-isopropylmalate dehydratase small subunit [Sphingomonas bisphenolicum]
MRAFSRLEALIAPLPNANIDTDQIIPARYLKAVEREGLGLGLFEAMRYDADGQPNPDFVLNRPDYEGTAIIVAGDNFGCGSSREHAPWALLDYGISCVISTSFADIFFNNCFQNGLLPVILTAEEVQQLMNEAKGGSAFVTVDLLSQTVTSPSGATFSFQIDPHRKEKMLKGLDAIGETLQEAPAIDLFEQRQVVNQPWLERA